MVNNPTLSANPYYIDTVNGFNALGSHYLDETNGAPLLNPSNAESVSDLYEDPCQWAIYHVPCDPCDPCQTGFAEYTVLSEDTFWAPQYDLCDEGRFRSVMSLNRNTPGILLP